MGTATSSPATAPAARRSPPRRALAALVPLGALALLLGGCGEAHHYEVDLDGTHRRVDEHGQPLPGEAAHGEAEAMAGGAAQGAAAAAGPSLEGTVELDAAFASLAGQGRLFVSVKSPQAAGGMPIAVAAIDAPRFPQDFRLTTDNIPLDVDNKAELLSGELKITARLSLSGNAIGKPGDIESEPQIVKAGGEKLVLRLTRRRDG